MQKFIPEEWRKRVFLKGTFERKEVYDRRTGRYENDGVYRKATEISVEMSMEAQVFWLVMANGTFPGLVSGYRLIEVDGNAALYAHPKKGEKVVDLEKLLTRHSWAECENPWYATDEVWKGDRKVARRNASGMKILVWEVTDEEEEFVRRLGESRTTVRMSSWANWQVYLKEHPLVRLKLHEPDVDWDDHPYGWGRHDD